MIIKLLFASVLSTLPLAASISHTSSTSLPTLDDAQSTIPSDPNFHPYVGIGFSSIAVVPYGANIAIGSRYAQNDLLVGLDQSINFTSTFASQYIFSKTLIPFYFSPQTVTDSYYAGPFITVGYNNQLEDPFDEDEIPQSSYLLINGFTFGKHISYGDKLSFWQVSANLRKYNLTRTRSKTSIWPTLTFQYGIGF